MAEVTYSGLLCTRCGREQWRKYSGCAICVACGEKRLLPVLPVEMLTGCIEAVDTALAKVERQKDTLTGILEELRVRLRDALEETRGME